MTVGRSFDNQNCSIHTIADDTNNDNRNQQNNTMSDQQDYDQNAAQDAGEFVGSAGRNGLLSSTTYSQTDNKSQRVTTIAGPKTSAKTLKTSKICPRTQPGELRETSGAPNRTLRTFLQTSVAD